MAIVYLGLGGNLGDRQKNLQAAFAGITDFPKTRLLAKAGMYQTSPVGGPVGQGDYLNSVCGVETVLSPRELLLAIHKLERAIGRQRENEPERWGARLIDIDILLYDDCIIAEDGLSIPHPRMAGRRFVLEPLAELIPDFRHPALDQSIRELLRKSGAGHERVQRIFI